MKHTLEEGLKQAKELLEIQGAEGNWNHDSYMQGMYNGMELVIATIEGREPNTRSAPAQWLADLPSPTAPTATNESESK